MLITLDPYYSVDFYNSCKDAMLNNNAEVKQYICIRPPYNWYIDVPHKPVLLNWDPLPESYNKWLVNVVEPVLLNDEIKLFRRSADKGKFKRKFIMNDAYKDLDGSEVIVFNASGHEELVKLSKAIPHKIWFLGRYYNKRIRLCMVKKSDIVESLLPKEQILMVKNNETPFEEMEAHINYKIFYMKDMVKKFALTPYFLNGAYILPIKRPEPLEKYVRL